MKRAGQQPLGRDRWPFHYNGVSGDRLVHSVLAAYGTRFEAHEDLLLPNEGITECGVYINPSLGVLAHIRQGDYVDDTWVVTCLRCASGISRDGMSFRQTQKSLNFAHSYGSRIPMQQIPRTKSPLLRPAKALNPAVTTTIVDEVMDWRAAYKKLL